jgi:hypothetical protein
MSDFGPPERVYVEIEWYDGPRAGIADVEGVPHRFKSQFDEAEDEYLGTYWVWPVDGDTLDLEIEQWKIFVAWNDLYEAGDSDVSAHPGHGGINKRWDEIQNQLQAIREYVPEDAKSARVKVERMDHKQRYLPSGPSYTLCWCLL